MKTTLHHSPTATTKLLNPNHPPKLLDFVKSFLPTNRKSMIFMPQRQLFQMSHKLIQMSNFHLTCLPKTLFLKFNLQSLHHIRETTTANTTIPTTTQEECEPKTTHTSMLLKSRIEHIPHIAHHPTKKNKNRKQSHQNNTHKTVVSSLKYAQQFAQVIKQMKINDIEPNMIIDKMFFFSSSHDFVFSCWMPKRMCFLPCFSKIFVPKFFDVESFELRFKSGVFKNLFKIFWAVSGLIFWNGD